MKKIHGGPAFPVGPGSTGMTLLDWFAGQALAGVTAYPHGDMSKLEAAKWAYDMAVLMLREREARS